MNNGFEGSTFTVQDGYAVTPAAPDAATKTVINDVTSFAQLGTASNGYFAYQLLPAGQPERTLFEKRLKIHAADLKSAVYDPTLSLVSKTQTEKGSQLDQIIVDARIKYLAGQFDDAGLKAQIQRWYSEGGTQIVAEMNEQYKKIK